jgi:hypothetical protein
MPDNKFKVIWEIIFIKMKGRKIQSFYFELNDRINSAAQEKNKNRRILIGQLIKKRRLLFI